MRKFTTQKKIIFTIGAVLFILAGCSRNTDNMDAISSPIPETISTENTAPTDKDTEQSVKKEDELENLVGQYDYLSDYGIGKLMIENTSNGYSISDYESESSYRFLADASNIEIIKDNNIYIKYPEQVFSDDTVIFSYYILEYSTNEISVYYGKSIQEVEFLYHATKNTESNIQTSENINSEMTAEELLDLFINGSVNAVDSSDLTSTFYITDLDMDSYSIGEKVDLDNDGENELIICGPYGGIYLDAHDNKVYQFAAGDGNALMLSYVVYNGAIWIMYSNRMNTGYQLYHMEKFEGSDHLVAEMNFSEEPIDTNNIESGMKYILNGTEISYDEYYKLGSKIFATEVYTN